MFHVIVDELARCLTTETVVLIPNATHAMHLANASYYNQLVLQYLGSH
jgi:pimeloyl-ACP methyl ester carboxylesterase